MKTQAELKAFSIGAIFGIMCFLGSLVLIRYTMGIAWQPVVLW